MENLDTDSDSEFIPGSSDSLSESEVYPALNNQNLESKKFILFTLH